MQIVSWCTEDYKEVLYKYALPSLENLRLPYNIFIEESLKEWKKNTNLKPVVALKALEQEQQDILLIDADARIYEYPKLLNEIPEEYDCAMFWLRWEEWYGHTKGKEELCSGTLFFRNRQICIDLITRWKEIGQKSNYPDQRNLEQAVLEFGKKINIYKLPFEYCWISTLPNGEEPKVKRLENIIIEHFQSSREMRRKING